MSQAEASGSTTSELRRITLAILAISDDCLFNEIIVSLIGFAIASLGDIIITSTGLPARAEASIA